MRRRAQASIIAALFVLVAFAVLAVGFANVLMAQQNYASQFQQAVQTDQTRSAESLTIVNYSYSQSGNTYTYSLYVRNNAPIASEILRVYYYNSTYFNWKWVNMSVGPGATVKVPIVVNTPITNPSFALVTALGNVFKYKPTPSLPMPASYNGQIWGGDTYSYGVNIVTPISSGELYYRAWSTTSPASFNATNSYQFSSSASNAILVIYTGFYPPYTANVSTSSSKAIKSSLTVGLASPSGTAVTCTISTTNYYNISKINLGGTTVQGAWFPPYKFHAIKLIGNGASASYLVYLDGLLMASYQPGGTVTFNGASISVTSSPSSCSCWYVSLISAYKNDTVNVYNVPAGWKVEIIGTDAIGRPVFLEAVNTASVPSTVTINIDNYYAPITGQLVVTP
ncbi:hypothetical protein [Conexivisphaera calida]|uniref:Uncharacterized protein n=1 Tax=Conexivisphaera calida TaxID=1874277 RepID=A0A4P2VBQ9_9ARCH|nr:hypothetical protein [Conexivisphaera calida]BBE41974.1 hypothetical protein NAS2_0585 [Conexivisphaera calida]